LEKDLSDRETALWNAWKSKDVKPFEMHLTDDTVMVDSSGVSGKSSISEGMKMCDIKSVSLSDWKLTKLSPSTALITYKGTQEGACGGAPIPPVVWASSIWMKRKDTWVAVFHQETPAR
ncbi:MAG: DUF4440 domain-containing protein, partial [Pyrinomonadaceae bacterium]